MPFQYLSLSWSFIRHRTRSAFVTDYGPTTEGWIEQTILWQKICSFLTLSLLDVVRFADILHAMQLCLQVMLCDLVACFGFQTLLRIFVALFKENFHVSNSFFFTF